MNLDMVYRFMKFVSALLFFVIIALMTGCATPPPKDPENLCAIYQENRDWYISG